MVNGVCLYKFTGQYTMVQIYDQYICNKIAVFSNDGIKSEYDMMKYAKDNTSLVNNIRKLKLVNKYMVVISVSWIVMKNY